MLNKLEELNKLMNQIDYEAMRMEKYSLSVLIPIRGADDLEVYKFIEHLYGIVGLCSTMLEEFEDSYRQLNTEVKEFALEFKHYIEPVEYSTPILIKETPHDNTLFNLKADMLASVKKLSDARLSSGTTDFLVAVSQMRNNLWLVLNYVSNAKKLRVIERQAIKGEA